VEHGHHAHGHIEVSGIDEHGGNDQTGTAQGQSLKELGLGDPEALAGEQGDEETHRGDDQAGEEHKAEDGQAVHHDLLLHRGGDAQDGG